MTSGQSEIHRSELTLPPMLNLAEAGPLAKNLLLLRGRDVGLDASRVEHLGAPCAQVLLSAWRTWRADGQAIAIDAPSTGFDEGLRLLGLTRSFGGEA